MADHDSMNEALRRSTEAANKADDTRRKAASQDATKRTEEARKASEETLDEQSNRQPEPSQEAADQIAVGAYNLHEPEELEQPEGPAQRAADGVPDVLTRQLQAAGGEPYKTRSAG